MRAPLPHPFASLSRRARRRALLACAVLALALMLELSALEAKLRTPASPHGIVSFELAGNAERAGSILEAWGPEGSARATRSLWLDFFFLTSYAPAIGLLCAAASDRARIRESVLAGLGAALAWGQLAAGGLDAIENFALLRVLSGASLDRWPAVAAACAWPKFALVAAGLIYVLAAWLAPDRRGREAR